MSKKSLFFSGPFFSWVFKTNLQMGRKIRDFVSLTLIFSLLVQNGLYAGAPTARNRLDEPLLFSGFLSAPQEARMLGRHEEGDEERLDLEMAMLSSTGLPDGELEAESRTAAPPKVQLFPLSPEAEDFLDCYGLTPDMLRERDISFADFQALFDTDTSLFWNWGRFIAINRSFPHLLKAPFRGGKPVYPAGGMAPIANPKKRMLPAFIEAFTGTTGENLERVFKLFIIAFLGLDLAKATNVGQAVSQFWNDEETAVNHLLSFLRTVEGPYVIAGVLSTPFIWGIVQGVLTARELKHDDASHGAPHSTSGMLQEHLLDAATHSRFKGTADYLESHHQTVWTHYLRPFLMGFVPFKEDAIGEHLSEMVSVLRWSTSVTPEEGRDILRAVSAVAQQQGIVGTMAADQLLEIVYGVNFRDFKHLLSRPHELTQEDKERLLMYLEIRAKGLSTLRGMGDVKARWAKRKGFLDGVEGIVQAIYAKSLLWYAGQGGSWTDPSAWAMRVFMLGLKAAKTWLFVSFFQAVAEAIREFIDCPNEFSNLKHGDIGEPNGTPQCLTENLAIYGTVFSGQSPEYLREMIDLTTFPQEGFDLDLSGKQIDLEEFQAIMGYFKAAKISLRSLALSDTFNSAPNFWYSEIGATITEHPELQSLDVSRWNFTVSAGYSDLLDSLNLSHLRSFNTSSSPEYAIGIDPQYYPMLTESLANFVRRNPALTALDASNTMLGYDPSSQQDFFQSLFDTSHLQTLRLSSNAINFTNTTQVQKVATVLERLRDLQIFTFNPQTTEVDPTYLEILNSGLHNTTQIPIGFVAHSDAIIQTFVDALPTGTASVDLTNMFTLAMTPGDVELLFQSLYQRLPGVTSVILANNNLGAKSSAFLRALGHGINQFPLTTLDLSNNSFSGATFAPLVPSVAALSQLQILRMQSTDFSLSGSIAALTDVLSFLGYLRELDLSACDLEQSDPSNMFLLAEALDHLPDLQVFKLPGNAIGFTGPQGLVAVAQKVAQMRNIKSFFLNNNQIGNLGPDDEVALAEVLIQHPHISLSSDLWGNNAIGSTGPAGLFAIARAVTSRPTVSQFAIPYNRLGSAQDSLEAITALGDALGQFPELHILDFTNNPLGTAGHVALARTAPNWRALRTLLLSETGIGTDGTDGEVAWGQALRWMENLTQLDCSSADIALKGPEGLEALAKGFSQSNAPYTSLLFNGNYFEEFPGPAQRLVNSLPWASPSLTTITLFGQNMIFLNSAIVEALSQKNRATLMTACAQQACHGGALKTMSASMTGIASTRTMRRIFEVPYADRAENISVHASDSENPEDDAPSPFSLTRWAIAGITSGAKAGSTAVSGWVSRFSRATKELVYDSFGDWITKKLTDAAHEATRDNHAYFPNIHNPNVRDWPTSAVYLNTTSSYAPLPALPAGR